jgi:putative hemolysin
MAKNGTIVILFIVLAVFLASCANNQVSPAGINQETNGEIKQENSVGIANPASEYCVKNGGKLRIVDEPNGQIGICTLPSGKECEEWAYFRKECPKADVNSSDDKNVKLLRICPDEWIQNEMPQVISDDQINGDFSPKEYFIVNLTRRELSEFDIGWVRANCNIRPQVVS